MKPASVNPIKYRETVEAMQLFPHTRKNICAWLNDGSNVEIAWHDDDLGEDELYVLVEFPAHIVEVGQWIVRRANGELCIFDNEEFAERFAGVEREWIDKFEHVAKAIANDRTVRRGGIASENVLSCLPAISRNDVIADAKAAIAALESQS